MSVEGHRPSSASRRGALNWDDSKEPIFIGSIFNVERSHRSVKKRPLDQ